MKDLKEGYKLNKDTFIIDQPYFEEVFYVVKDNGEEDPEEPIKEKVLISFEANGGRGRMQSVEVEKDTEYVLPENEFIAPYGEKFYAWEIDGIEYMVGDVIKATKDMEIRALWTKIMRRPQPRPRSQPKPTPSENESKEKEQVMKEKPANPLVIGRPTQVVNLTDIPNTNAGTAIRNMVARGILKGTGNGRFEPETTVSRAMIAELLKRISVDQTINASIQFADVMPNDWFSMSVKWAATHGLVTGYQDGTFKANKKHHYRNLL